MQFSVRSRAVKNGKYFVSFFSVFILILLLCSPSPAEDATAQDHGQLLWHDDYAKAMDEAERRGKMLFILFSASDGTNAAGESEANGKSRIDDAHRSAIVAPEVQEKLKDFVRVELPLDAKVMISGKDVAILELPAFDEMLGGQGMAIIDFAHKEFHGDIVSMFPLYRGQAFTAEEILAMLDLPEGTLTQRTLIYAVRTHPERPGSTDGQILEDLSREAEMQSCYQARLQSQGHHNWETRFQRIRARLSGGLTASEVCAESWPGEGLLAAAIECVRCWRQSSGHWRAVRERHPCYGYDMKRGNNGIWYATGIFGQRR